MKNGWIKLHRKSLNSLVFGNEKCWKIWCWCLMKAGHRENTFLLGRKKITLKRSQFIMGLKKSKEELDLAVSTIHYWLAFLEKEGMVELKKTNKYTIITIKNWGKYQDVELQKNSNENANETLKETNKNDKNVKNDKEVDTNVSTGVKEVMDIFYKFNPSLNWGNKTYRKAAADLIKLGGLEATKELAAAALSIQGKPYAPVITNPWELKEKAIKVKIFFDNQNNKSNFVQL